MYFKRIRVETAKVIERLAKRVLGPSSELNPFGIITPSTGSSDPLPRWAVDASYRGPSSTYGGDCQLVSPGQEVDIQRSLFVEGRIIDLDVAPSLSKFFDVLSLKIGRDEQLAAHNFPLPASAFSRKWRAEGAHLNPTKICPTSLYVTLRVRNTAKKPHHFKAFYVLEQTPWRGCP